MRIFPTYYFFLTVYIIKKMFFSINDLEIGASPMNILCNFLLINGWGFEQYTIIGSSWAVSVELFAYFCFPALIRLTDANRPASFLVLGVVPIFILWFVVASALGVSGQLDVVSTVTIYPMARCIASFSIGILSYYAKTVFELPSYANSDNVSFSVLVVAVLLFLYATDLIFVVLVFPVAILLLAEGQNFISRFCAKTLFLRIGLLSYSMYLSHQLFYFTLLKFCVFFIAPIFLSELVSILLQLIVTFVVSELLYRLIKICSSKQ